MHNPLPLGHLQANLHDTRLTADFFLGAFDELKLLGVELYLIDADNTNFVDVEDDAVGESGLDWACGQAKYSKPI